jgi:hypothetical protein
MFVKLEVKFIDTPEHGSVVKEFWIGDMMHQKIAIGSYVKRFPNLQIYLRDAEEMTGGGLLDVGMLDSIMQQLILQLNSGEKRGIITTPPMLSAFSELLTDFDILPNAEEYLSGYIIGENVAARFS